MKAFFDTSAIVPLIFREPHSAKATKAWEESEFRLGWHWLRVEAEAALVRRKGGADAWNLWRTIEASLHWTEPDGDWLGHLKAFNRGVGLRAADAGHLYVMESCARALPDLVLITFDLEMAQAAVNRGLSLSIPIAR